MHYIFSTDVCTEDDPMYNMYKLVYIPVAMPPMTLTTRVTPRAAAW